jgi:predicted Zn-dependent protease
MMFVVALAVLPVLTETAAHERVLPADPPAQAVDRAAALEALLAPASLERAAAAASPGKDAKQRTESQAAYDRALVFYTQGAWAEAEKEFRNAEKKDGDNVEHLLALGWVYNKLHKPADALKRFEKVYKRNPRDTRALVGLAASYEEAQNYREAVRMWQRYSRLDLPAPARLEAAAFLRAAQDMFVTWYEIAENPGGGAKNLMSTADELAWGKQLATELASAGWPELQDPVVSEYVQNLCTALANQAKHLPSAYEVHVYDNSLVNAMTVPGHIFVFRGLLAAVDSESELAGVLAHEIGHGMGHHGAKEQTKAYQDQKQLAQYKASNSKFAQFLAKMLESGNPMGQLSFSRENESQADRLAVHILYDAGYDPRGFAEFFRKMESLSPSSRRSWDLMQRTHPFSIDRLNAINEYASLLPPKAGRTSTAAFNRMQAQLATLPPPVEQVTPPASPEPGAGQPEAGAMVPFTLESAPFAGDVPAGWGGRRLEAGTILFEGPKGTESYEVSIELGLEPKRTGLSIDHVAAAVVEALNGKPSANVQPPAEDKASDGTPVRIVAASYALRGSQGPVPIKHLTVVLDYPGHFVILSYFTPEAIFQKYSETFSGFISHLRYTGR